MWNPEILDTLLLEAAGGTYRPVTPSQMKSVIAAPKVTGRDRETDAPTRLLGYYTSNAYRDYNTLLKYGKLPQDWRDRQYLVKTRDAAENMTKGGIQQLLKSLYASRVVENFVLYRAAVNKEIGSITVGQTVPIKSFLSGSISLERTLDIYINQRGRFTSGRLWRLLVPAGAAARWVAPLSFHEGEQEVLLPPGTILKVISIDQVAIVQPGEDPFMDASALAWPTPREQTAMMRRAKMNETEWRMIKRLVPNQDWTYNAVDTFVTAMVTTPKTPQTPDTLFSKTTPKQGRR